MLNLTVITTTSTTISYQEIAERYKENYCIVFQAVVDVGKCKKKTQNK